MQSKAAMIVALFMAFLFGAALTGVLFFTYGHKTADKEKKFLICKSNENTITLMMNEKEKTLAVSGSDITSDKIVEFNDLVISAKWNHKFGTTTLVLDRLRGNLEITDAAHNAIDVKPEILECSNTNQKF